MLSQKKITFLVIFVYCSAALAADAAAFDERSADEAERLNVLENLVLYQDSAIRNMQATIESQAKTIRTMERRMDSLVVKSQDPQHDRGVGFYVDLETGHHPYSEVNVTSLQPIIFHRVQTNVGEDYNPATGVFTSPTPGLYIFHLHFMAGFERETELGIFKGDQVIAVAVAEGSKQDYDDSGSCTAVVHLDKGELVSVQHYWGEQTIWGSYVTSFSGVLVHAD